MDSELQDKLVTMEYLAVTFFNNLQNEYYKALLPQKYQEPKNKLESIMLGNAHLVNLMEETIGDSPFSLAFEVRLEKYAQGFFEKHNLKTIATHDFNVLYNQRMIVNKGSLKMFKQYNFSNLLIENEVRRLIFEPLKTNFEEHEIPMSILIPFLSLYKNFFKTIDKAFQPLQETLRNSFNDDWKKHL